MDYEAIIEGCRRHNRTAQRSLYDELVPMVMGVCTRYADSHEAAEDMAQDAFVKIYEKIGLLQEPSKLRSWAYNIAVNTCIDAFRRKRMRLEDIDMTNMTADDNDDAELPYTTAEIADALSRLTPRQRIVFNLCCIEELSADKAAARLACSASNIRAVLCDARHKLRTTLETKKTTI